MLNPLISFIKLHIIRKPLIQEQIAVLAGFSPGNTEIYLCALTHKSLSGTARAGNNFNNERLEFLGDSILSAVIADHLFSEYPDRNEGFLTKMRSRMVSRHKLNAIALEMGFDRMITLPGKALSTKKHIYGNALEAFIGAIYVDKGFSRSKQFIIEKILGTYLDLDELVVEDSDFKSRIIQWGQKNKQQVSFENHELTIDHTPQPVFLAKIHIMDMLAGEGTGATKKEAQQHAARQALENLPS